MSDRETRTNPWIACRRPPQDPRLRLLCLAYAGASSAVYRDWQKGLPDWIEVCPVELPGRWSRRREPLFTRVEPLIEALCAGIEPLLDLPTAIFGHSLGGLLGFELAQELRRRRLPEPVRLFASAIRAPQTIQATQREPIHRLPDALFLKRIGRQFGGFPDAVLRDPELLEIVVPPTRADVEMIETYRYRSRDPLDCPISVFFGSEDRTQSLEDLRAWGTQTRRDCDCVEFRGGHFFVEERREEVLSSIASSVRSSILSGSP